MCSHHHHRHCHLALHHIRTVFICCGSKITKVLNVIEDGLCLFCFLLFGFSEKKHENIFQKQRQNKDVFRHTKAESSQPADQTTGVLKGSSFNRETPDGNVGPQNNVKSPENAAMWGVRTFLI